MSPSARNLLWGDFPNNRVLRQLDEDGHVGVARSPSNCANGATSDWQGWLINCEHGRRVTRTKPDGSLAVILDRFVGVIASSAETRRVLPSSVTVTLRPMMFLRIAPA